MSWRNLLVVAPFLHASTYGREEEGGMRQGGRREKTEKKNEQICCIGGLGAEHSFFFGLDLTLGAGANMASGPFDVLGCRTDLSHAHQLFNRKQMKKSFKVY